MNTDRRTEEHVREWQANGPQSIPEHVLQEVMQQTQMTPQARRRTLGRWFARGEGARRRSDDHDQSPDTRRTRFMFSATGLVAAFAILALAVNIVDPAASPPQTGSAQQLVVAADGGGDFNTINDAVAVAADGDTILIRPGIYDEAIRIDKDINLIGDGPRETIVIDSLVGPLIDLDGSNASLSGFTLDSKTAHVNVSGGAPTLEDLWFRNVGVPFEGGAFVPPALFITGASSVTVRDNLFTDSGAIDVSGDAAPLIERNELLRGSAIRLYSAGEGTVIRGNTIRDNLSFALRIEGGGALLVEGNVLDGSGTEAVSIGFGAARVTRPVLRKNTITRAPLGIRIFAGTAPILEGNRIDADGAAIHFEGPANAVFSGNTICGAESIVSLRDPDMPTPSLEGNEICDIAATAVADSD
jgi:hypothetical protein